MSHDEIVSVVQSHKAGKTIQYKVKGGSIWYECPGFPSWNFDSLDYRVKPEPLRIWVNCYPDSRVSFPKRGFNFAYVSKSEAERSTSSGGRAVEFVEVARND